MDIASDVKERSLRLAEQQKEIGAAGIDGVADAFHSAADELEHKMPQAASYVRDAADRIEGVASKLKEHSVDGLLNEVGGFARTQPLLFFTGAVLAGITLSRFLKSSGAGDQTMRGRDAI
jgi:hypothetical protein